MYRRHFIACHISPSISACFVDFSAVQIDFPSPNDTSL